MGLKEQLGNAVVSELNIRPPVTISDTSSVREAVSKMREANMGCVIAVDDDKKAVGVFTEAMLRHAINRSITVLDEPLADHIVARLPWVLPTDEVKMVLDAMEEHNIRFIAVLDKDRSVIGITGQKGMMEFVAELFPHEVLTQDATAASSSLQKEGA